MRYKHILACKHQDLYRDGTGHSPRRVSCPVPDLGEEFVSFRVVLRIGTKKYGGILYFVI
jgi:hypothetical protein